MRAGIALVAITLAATTARAEPTRYALVIGANRGEPDDAELKYAESDARGFATTLIELGGFAADRVAVLEAPRAADVRGALARIQDRIAQAGEPEALLVVYYSGHGDAQALHLAGSQLAIGELRHAIDGSAASARVLIVDSCRSGAVTRVKGGTKGAAFAIQLEADEAARGTVVITSSAAGEDAQESEALRGSIFTFHLRSALGGSADANGDDRVTISEAFAFTKDATLATSIRSIVGPQHPTFEVALAGRGDLVLTRVATTARRGTLHLPAGHWFVFGSSGTLVAELEGGRRLAVPAGRYTVVQRKSDHLLEGRVAVAAGAAAEVAPDTLARVDYARWVRRGLAGSPLARRPTWSAFVDGIVHSDLRETGVPVIGADAGVRVDRARFAFEGRAALWRRDVASEGLRTERTAAELAIAVVRTTDVGPFALGIGGELAGGVNHTVARRPMEAASTTTSPVMLLGPVAQAQLPLGRWYLRLDLGGAVVLQHDQEDSGPPRFRATLGYRSALGAGVHF